MIPRMGSVLALSFLALVWTRVKTEEFFLLRNRQDNVRYRNLADKNAVTSVEKAQEILRHYGYLSCGDNKTGSRKKEVSSKPCSETDFQSAVRQYQLNFNMPETGVLDADTYRMMSESRCGNSDETSQPAKPLIKHQGQKRKKLRRKNRKQRTKRHMAWQAKSQTMGEREELPPGDTLSRREKWLLSYLDDLKSGEHYRRLERQHDQVQRRRRKRSIGDGHEKSYYGFPTDTVTWRLVNSAYSNQMTAAEQKQSLALAFRMWSEVVPVIFVEDIRSEVDDVDILIAFGKGEHMNCPNHFDGFGGQLAHALRGATTAEIHVDDDEHLTLRSEHGTNLLKVTVHEVGHALGLHHVSRNASIMYAIYSKVLPNSNFELGLEDRRAVQKIYGVCRGRFDSVFDWVRRRPDGQMIYNTYFFRGNRYWMYENRFNRTRYGDPLPISPEWRGVPDNIDTYVHVWTYQWNDSFFFKGNHYWRYNNTADSVMAGYPRNIEEDFGAIPGTNFPNIPRSLNAAFFDQRDSNLYFFKKNMVYAYNYSLGTNGCCLHGYPREINDEFPPVPDSPESQLPINLDAVYYSYTDRTMYFFKGQQYWQNVAFNPIDRRRTNRVRGPFQIVEKWADICEVELPTIIDKRTMNEKVHQVMEQI